MKFAELGSEKIFEILNKSVDRYNVIEEVDSISYPYFIKYFSDLETINLENVIIGISFTYSWMPTMLKKLLSENRDVIVEILNKAKQGENLDKEDLNLLKKAFNNSLVGTSKLLHFINPEKYAIWDSKIFRVLYGGNPHKYKIENAESYLAYLKFINELVLHKDFEEFYARFQEKINGITKMRAVELALFKCNYGI